MKVSKPFVEANAELLLLGKAYVEKYKNLLKEMDKFLTSNSSSKEKDIVTVLKNGLLESMELSDPVFADETQQYHFSSKNIKELMIKISEDMKNR